MSIEGMPPEYTLLLVDGQRWSGEIGGVGDASDISLQNVERIEVLRGGQGARYGGDAGGGIDQSRHARRARRGLSRCASTARAAPTTRALGGGDRARRGVGPGRALALRRVRPDRRLRRALGSRHRRLADRRRGLAPPPVLPVRQVGRARRRTRSRCAATASGASRTTTSCPRTSTSTCPHGHQLAREPRRRLARALDRPRLSGDFTYYAIETDSEVGREFVLDEDEIGRARRRASTSSRPGPIAHTLLGGVEPMLPAPAPRRGPAPAEHREPRARREAAARTRTSSCRASTCATRASSRAGSRSSSALARASTASSTRACCRRSGVLIEPIRIAATCARRGA